MSRVGVITALHLEARPLHRHPGLAVRVCGVAGTGIGNAVRELGELGSGLIVSWGTAGALSPRLRAGVIVVPDRIVTRNGTALDSDPGSRDAFRRTVDGSWPVASGTLLETDRVVETPDGKSRLGHEHDADAVDMESGRIAEACAAIDLPFLVIRVVVDELGDRLPRQLRESTSPDGSLRMAALLAGLIPHPGDWGSMTRLARRYRRARKGLDVAARGLSRCAANPQGRG